MIRELAPLYCSNQGCDSVVVLMTGIVDHVREYTEMYSTFRMYMLFWCGYRRSTKNVPVPESCASEFTLQKNEVRDLKSFTLLCNLNSAAFQSVQP